MFQGFWARIVEQAKQIWNHQGADTHASHLSKGSDGNGVTFRTTLFD